MNKYVLVLACCLLACLMSNAQARQDILFNDNWKFNDGDAAQAQAPAYDDQSWRTLDLPHDWAIEKPFSDQWASATGYLPGGIGWYRKTFTVPATWKGKSIVIDFDGVYNNSEVWINGQYLGKRPNGFVPFQYDLTRYIKLTGSNTIAVKADHSKFADSRWYTGSGIYRDVHLVAMDPVHIQQWGIAFQAPAVTTELAKTHTEITINNTLKRTGAVTVRAQLLDAAGKEAAMGEKKTTLSNDTSATASIDLAVSHPALWSVENPALYTLKVTLLMNGKAIDELSQQVGMRSIRFDASEGFFLNNKNIKLKGVCIHDDAGVLGVAVPEEVWIRRLEALKAAGCNSLRMSHNPHADYLYKLCDQMGFLVMDEAFDEWETGKNKWIKGWNKGEPGKDGYHEYFDEWAEKDIAAMMLRNRNHPSIIMWSIGNEIDYPNDPYSHEVLNTGRNPQIYGKGYLADHPAAARLGELSARLVKVVKSIDTTRPVTAALAGVVMSNTTSYPGNLDLVGYNYQEYRYEDDHKAYPNRIIYGSENGMALNAWNAVDSNQYISAQYLWTGIDYMGEAGLWPARSNGAGLLNLGGFPKADYYLRKTLWSDEPTIYIATSNADNKNARGFRGLKPDWNKKVGDSVSVICFTNCNEAELFLNGRSLGKQTIIGTHGIVSWHVMYEPGELMVKGYKQGKEVANYDLHSTGEPAIIKAAVYRHKMIAEDAVVKQIIVSVEDGKGNPIYAPGGVITAAVNGKAMLLGIENSNLADTSNYKDDHKQMMNGPLIAYVKAPKDGTAFSVSFSSPGLKIATIQFAKNKK